MNFRSLEGYLVVEGTEEEPSVRIQENRVFRHGTPSKVDLNDANVLLQDLQITTIVDLRSVEESRGPQGPLGQLTPLFSVVKMDQEESDQTSPYIVDDSKADHPLANMMQDDVDIAEADLDARVLSSGDLDGVDGDRRVYSFPLVNEAVINAIWATASWTDRVKAFFFSVFCNRKRASKLFNEHISSQIQLLGLNKLWLTHAKSEIIEALRVFTDSERFPITVCCSLGKDRTGLIIALLQSIAGVVRSDVLDDYCRSEELIAPSAQKLGPRLDKMGLDSKIFLSTPRSVMEDTLNWLDSQPGGLSGWLEENGLSADEQAAIRHNLLIPILNSRNGRQGSMGIPPPGLFRSRSRSSMNKDKDGDE